MGTRRSTVKWFDAKKGYGFIDHPDGGGDVFVHYTQIVTEQDFKTLRTGQEVEFELEDGPKGLHALAVNPMEEAADNDTGAASSARPPQRTGRQAEPRSPERHRPEPAAPAPVPPAAEPHAFGQDGAEGPEEAEDEGSFTDSDAHASPAAFVKEPRPAQQPAPGSSASDGPGGASSGPTPLP